MFTVTESGRHGSFGRIELGSVITTRSGTTEIRYSSDFAGTGGWSDQNISLSWSRSVLGNDALSVALTAGASRNAQPDYSTEIGYRVSF